MTRVPKFMAWLMAAAAMAGGAISPVVPATTTQDVPGLKTGRVTGTVLSVYNSPATFDGIKRGFAQAGFRLLRFPNGSMSNMYHWNGAGSRDDEGIWHGDSTNVLPGILSLTRYRGTTNASGGYHSNVTDGIDSTIWWSEPLGDSQPWVQLDLSNAKVDSVRIVWGALRPDSVVVGQLSTGFWNGYGGLDATLVPLARIAVTGPATEVNLPATSLRFLVIKPVGVKSRGVQIGEVSAWGAGVKLTTNAPSATTQTPVTAMGAHPGNDQAPSWKTPPSWTFAKYIDYIKGLSDVEPLICVNYGTGTPEEAAAWVKHANIDRKLGIKFWEIGNEMDGVWEEGGPVTARQYANKYIAFVKAMKAVDPSIVVFGPVMSTSEFDVSASAHLDGSTWTEEVLRIVGEAEAKDNFRYLDGFDFHAYPYWTDGKPTPTAALAAMRQLKPRLDTLKAMMGRHLKDPGSRLVNMSELNMSVVSSDLLLRAENATGIAMNLSQLVEANGGNSMSIVWEGFNGGSTGSTANGGTYGALSLFSEPRSGIISSEKFVPTAAYWGNWMVSKVWAIDSAKPLAATVPSNSYVDARALVLGTDTSWLLLNLGPRACSTQVSHFAKGWIYTFSKSQYTWNGTTDQAYAFPNGGPSGMPIPAGWNHVVEIPAYGMVVVRNTNTLAAPIAGEGRLINFTLLKKQIELGDTVKVSGTYLRDPGAVVPVAKIGDTTIALQAIDGAWDSEQEAFVASLAVDALKEGVWKLSIGSTDSVEFTVIGKVRPSVWIDRFNDQAMASEQPSAAKWNSWHADEAEAASAWDLSFVAREGNTNALLTVANLVQPTDLGYPVVGFTGLPLDSLLVSKSVGVQFEYATWHSNKTQGGFALGLPTDTVKDYQDYSISLANTDSVWKQKRVLWTQFSQPSWAKQCGPLLAHQINALNFRMMGEGKSRMWIDNIVLLGTSGDSVVAMAPNSRRASWGVVPSQGAWQIQIPAGAKVTVVGLDGRRLAVFAPEATSRKVNFRSRNSGVAYAILESPGFRDQRVLATMR